MRIAIIGGTGKEGQGLALGWARAGQQVIIGSRAVARAQEAAAAINTAVGRPAATGMSNPEAAAAGDIAVVTVPYAAHEAILKDIQAAVQGKIVVDVTVPLNAEKPRRLRVAPGGSATEEAQALLGAEARVVAAFQNISYKQLAEGAAGDCDVLVCGDDPEARRQVIGLAGLLGFRGLDAGPARNARVVEGLTVLLIGINVRYKATEAGIRVTGIPEGKQS